MKSTDGRLKVIRETSMCSTSPATEASSFSEAVTLASLSVVEETSDGQDLLLEIKETEFEGSQPAFINEIFICP